MPDGAGGAAAAAVAGRVVLRIRLRFHDHTPQQLAIGLPFHQLAADELGGNDLGGVVDEGWGRCAGGSWWLWEWLDCERKILKTDEH